MMEIALDRSRAEPLYRQIAEQIRTRILDGGLQPGVRLPTVRALAAALDVSKLTVFRAYAELQEAALIVATVGSGTLVASKMPREAGAEFLGTLTKAGPLNTFEAVSHDIGLRSLASAVPDPALFYFDEFLAECYSLRRDSPWLFYYAPPAGCSELIREIARLLAARGVAATDEQIAVTNGSTHARALIVEALTVRGDVVLYQEPSILGLPEWLRAFGLRPVALRSDQGGIDPAALDQLAAHHRPVLAFVSPTFGHATGVALPQAQRMELLRLAQRHDFMVVEDDSCALLSYDRHPPDALGSIDRDGRAIHVGSFSYCLGPGLRTGFIHARAQVRDRIVDRSRLQGISGTQFLQVALARYLRAGRLGAHLARVLPKYRVKRDAMLAALKATMPPGTHWTRTEGGFSTWVSLPANGRYSSLYQSALQHGVAFSPGSLLANRPDADRYMRLSFGTQSAEGIRRAIETLARLVADRSLSN